MLCRCLAKHSWPRGKKGRKYIGYVKPFGYPDTAAVCGSCDNPAVVWLDEMEVELYEQGNRIFNGPTQFVSIKVDNDGIMKM
ncbi:hypothetical protein [Pelosinus sp. sgz500959]|uniref:hypothetical protein n=1 Tax=Pelosinus sp. sgz500959 TaxID=3242472 RepID=UPI00366D36F8